MANSDKNILITPNIGLSGQPEIALTGAGNSTMYIRVPDDTNASLNFESGSGKKVFKLDNNFSSGNIFEVNNESNLSYLDVSSSGNVRLSNFNNTSLNAKGLKLPIFSNSNLPTGEEGQLVYDSTEKCVKIFIDNRWESLISKEYVRNNLALDYNSFRSYPGSGTILYDVSGYNINGTLNNGVGYTVENGGSLVFNGTNTFVSVPTIGSNYTQITVESWIFPRRSPSTGTIRGAAVSGDPSHYLGIFDSVDGGSTHSLHWALQTSVSRPGSAVGNIPIFTWSHIVGTYDGSRMKAYINGVLLYDVALTGTISGDGRWSIGSYFPSPTDGTHNFDGRIASAKIYNRALSASEISQNFNALRGRFGI